MSSTASNETLISTFEMLIERLNAIETRLDKLQDIAAHDQECRHVGKINAKAWNLEVYLYLHERIPRGMRKNGKASDSYVVHTNLDINWYWDGCIERLFAGEYDDYLNEPAKAKAKVAESEKAGQGVLCEDLGIMYERSCFYEYLLDLTMTKCLTAGSYKSLWESVVMVNPYASEANVFWLVANPGTGERTIREISKTMIAVKELFDTKKKLVLSICPLSDFVFGQFKKLYELETELRPEDYSEIKAKRAEIAELPWMKEIDRHAYWERLRITDPEYF